MFPDPDIRWIDYPSLIDGIAPPPSTYDLGTWKGMLALAVHGRVSDGSWEHFRVEIYPQVYFGVDEMIYSVAGHGDRSGRYGGGVFIKRAATSRLLTLWESTDPHQRPAKHFLFVGSDFCFEALVCHDPVIRLCKTEDEAWNWPPKS